MACGVKFVFFLLFLPSPSPRKAKIWAVYINDAAWKFFGEGGRDETGENVRFHSAFGDGCQLAAKTRKKRYAKIQKK